MTIWRRFGFILCVGFLFGCSPSDKPLVPASGQATYGGGPWPIPGTITLTPISSPEGIPNRPASARFGVDGKFILGSYQPGDGIMPGTYSIKIACYDPLQASKPRHEIDHVPANYSPVNLVVEKGQDAITLNFDVPKKK